MTSRTSDSSSWYFTAPYDAPQVRRGDPLGLRQAATAYSEVVAPALSNRTVDVRWMSICAWMLVQANDVWRRSGGTAGADLSRKEAAELWEWMQPLELLWIARSATLSDEGGRQLPGQRAVRRWLVGGQRARRFGMSIGQYRRQRSLGVYGSYRVALRGLPGMTVAGNGWTPGAESERLARIVQSALGRAAASPVRAHGNYDPESFWRQKGWPTWDDSGGRMFLPESRKDIRPVTEDEIDVHRPLLFGEGDLLARRRREVAYSLAASTATEHHRLCADLEKKLSKITEGAVSCLGSFAWLADSGLKVMNAIWGHLLEVQSTKVPKLSPAQLADAADLRECTADFVEASRRWRARKASSRPEWATADELATLVLSSGRNRTRLLSDLVAFHENRGGGRRWFRLDEKGLVHAPMRLIDQEGSPYRFRLASLARLARQCNVTSKMPPALAPHEQEDDE